MTSFWRWDQTSELTEMATKYTQMPSLTVYTEC